MASRPDILLGAVHDPQQALPLAADDVQRWVWRTAYGDMLIECDARGVYVNGQWVEPASAFGDAVAQRRPGSAPGTR